MIQAAGRGCDARRLKEKLVDCGRVLLPFGMLCGLLPQLQGVSYPLFSLTETQMSCIALALHTAAVYQGCRAGASRGWFCELSRCLLASEITLFLVFLQHEGTLGLLLVCLLLGGLIAVTTGRRSALRCPDERQLLTDNPAAAGRHRRPSGSPVKMAARRYLVVATAVVLAAPSLTTLTVYGFDTAEPSRLTGTVHALDSLSGDNMMLANLSTIRLFDDAAWERLSEQEKVDALQVVADIETHHLRIEPVTVVAWELDGSTFGAYNSAGRIVKFGLEQHRGYRPAEWINTVLHECRHAYQKDCVDALDWDDPETAGKFYYGDFRQWKEELEQIVPSGRDGYYQQAVERDARNYADSGVQDYEQYIQFVGLPAR